ncbi:DNA-binding response regulator, LytR/AlgR family [Chitinophaga sp. YR627]|uniref:LytR/AlgR family response regulator transcription factor n=1 Tax=Chitinophaga sp. YR627 TaxID=1881041 RepID=UPI0008F1AC6C|nr:response regulator [Chitinophaga sp. YR627]SFO29478.1 DNA-binding response regulator, LytR/AlgR family [Chitinophaga sp. YR627]
MIKCLIIDDEQPAIDVIAFYIKRVLGLELVATSTKGHNLNALALQHNPNLVFFDIRIDDVSGLELVGVLPDHIKVIFCTAYSEFAVKSYKLNAIAYLMKPIEYNRFLKAVRRAYGTMTFPSGGDNVDDDYIFVESGRKGNMVRISLDELEYVEGLSNYVAFYSGKQKITTYLSPRSLEHKLSSSRSLRL